MIAATGLAVLGSACGGDGGGRGVDIEPDSGPPGTVISWTVSGCEDTANKSASLYTGSVEQYRKGDTEKLAESARGTGSSGKLAVPASAPPGSYTFTVGCSSSTEPTPEGEVTISISSKETSFEVTG